MIEHLEFRNYKAFANGAIEFSPITILLGANSVGKSSIIQLLLLLAQTANDKKNISALKINGDQVSLGSNLNLFRLKDTSKPIVLTFKLDDKFERTFNTEILGKLSTLLSLEKMNLERWGYNEISHQFNKQAFSSSIIESEDNFYKICDLIDNGYTQLQNTPYYITNIYKSTNYSYKEDYVSTFHILKKIQEISQSYQGQVFCSVGIGHNAANRDKTNILYVEHICIFFDNGITHKDLIKLCIQKPLSRATIRLSSDVIEDITIYNDELSRHKKQFITDVRSNLFNLFNNDYRSQFIFTHKPYEYSLQLDSILDILYNAINNIEKNINNDNINYVSPLRAYTKRYYFLDRTRATASLDTLNGDEIAATLKNNDYLKRKANGWLRHFGIQIDVHTLEDVINKVKVKQDKLQLDITDVGFGISQVLPIIIQGFFTKANTMTVIEQPEVHLHPKMQADLADLFIDMALPQNKKGKREYNKSLLIETHSEYILKRIRRRIADKTIEANDVSIYYIRHTQENTSEIQRIDISQTGVFEWPEEFYGGELLKDTLDFLRNQIQLA